jgi:general secretion pathway protein N
MRLPALPRLPVLPRLPRLARLPALRRRRHVLPRPSSVFADSTLASAAWARRRRAAWKWAAVGACAGAAVAALAWAPASWLAHALESATGERVQLADARGTVWSGTGVLLLSGGPGSRDASALPGRLRWDIGLSRSFLPELRLHHPCCQDAPAVLGVRAGIGTWGLTMPAQPAGLGTWPAAWLAGLGTPFNTLQMSGTVRISTPGASLEWAEGRLRMQGSVQFEFADVSSRIVAIDTLGSYRLVLSGGAVQPDAPVLSLQTVQGPLQLSGSGRWTGSRLRFEGEASAAEGSEAALNNLLNVIGRRNGPRSVISIG